MFAFIIDVMTIKALLLFLLLPSFVTAQTINYKIEGKIKNPENSKYAYLIIRGKKPIVKPIINGEFIFKDTIDLGLGFYKGGYLLLENRGNITSEEVSSKLKQGIWKLGVTSNLKNIALEDIKLDIEGSNIIDAAIIEGGELTRQMDELNQERKINNFKAFIIKYPDSPVSISFISSILYSFGIPMELAELERRHGSPRELFPLLSEKLRMSKKGIEVKRSIDEAYKNKQ